MMLALLTGETAMFERSQWAGWLLSVAATVAPAAYAHHSAAQFDFAQTVTVEGKVKLMEVRNPHIKLILEVTGNDGSAHDVEFEGHSRNNVYRRGWRPEMVDVGDTIAIDIAPLRDGSEGGYVKDFKLTDGTTF
jgi:hypothetical protein